MFLLKFKSGIRIRMEVKELAELVKEFQDKFDDCEVILETTHPDPAVNIKNAKIIGDAGVRGTWRNIKEKKI